MSGGGAAARRQHLTKNVLAEGALGGWRHQSTFHLKSLRGSVNPTVEKFAGLVQKKRGDLSMLHHVLRLKNNL